MIRRTFLASLVALSASPALAAEAEKPAKDVGQYVDVSAVAVPITAEGRLVNYVFVSIRVLLTSSANASKWRAKEPYFRDALARLVHRNSYDNPKDYVGIDAPRLIADFQREAVAIAGKDVKSVIITKQTAKQQLGLPRRAAPAPRAEIRP